jgi:putative spermidine/putrescine transport system permease protein
MIRLTRGLFCWLIVISMSAPLFVVAGVSVNEKKLMFFPPRGFSLRWFEEIFTKSAWFESLLASLIIAFAAGIIALSIALPTAYLLWRHQVRYAKILYSIGLLPFALPPVITALGMLIWWAQFGGTASYFGIALAHGIFLVTLPMIMISLGLESIEPELLEAAQTMGADQRKSFFTIVLPMITPYMVAGYAFAFVISINEFIISFFLGQFAVYTLPVKIFSSLRSGYTPTIASISVLFILLALVVFSLVARFGDLPRLLGAWSPKER